MLVADIEPDAAAGRDDAAPDVAREDRRDGAGVAEAGVGELRVLDRVAIAEEGEVAAHRTPLRATGDVRDQKSERRVAGGEADVGRRQLQLAAYTTGELLRGRGQGICRQSAEDRNGASGSLEERAIDGAGVQEDGFGDDGERGPIFP